MSDCNEISYAKTVALNMQTIEIWKPMNEQRELQCIGTMYSAGAYEERFSV